MKHIVIVIVGLALVVGAWAQTEKRVDTKIRHVTVFLSKAQVTREIKTRVEAGNTNLIVSGLTSLLDQQSIQVSGSGNVVIMGINHNQNFLNEFDLPSGLRKLQDSLDYYTKQLTLEQNMKEILNKEEQLLLSNQKIGGAQQNLTVSELKAMADFYRSRLNDIGLARIKSDDKIKYLNERITRLKKQIADQRGHYARNTSEIVISLSAEAATPVDLELNYVVSNAGWYPVYDLRAKDTKSPVQLNYKANVFQNTGEEWKNVKLTLSTANPSLGGLKPELYPWYIDFMQDIVYKRLLRGNAPAMAKSEMPVAYDAQEEKLAAAPAESVADYVNTIQTSLNTEFAIALPYTVDPTSKPTTVDIRNYSMKADYTYAVAPKLDQDAFLLAKATGWEEFSLLPGEANVFFEGTFVGKTYLDPNSIKDTLAISMGRDKRVVVKREKLKDYTTRRTIGANQRDSYAWEISVRNTKSEPVSITIEDQLPVSQNSQIEVTVVDAGGATVNKDTGKLEWKMVIQPNESKKVQYKYEVKYPKDKVIPGLN